VASKAAERLSAAEWAARADRYQSSSYVTTTDAQAMVTDLMDGAAIDPAAPVFTDDYAPIEMMAF
jgi:hypothetical protein